MHQISSTPLGPPSNEGTPNCKINARTRYMQSGVEHPAFGRIFEHEYKKQIFIFNFNGVLE